MYMTDAMVKEIETKLKEIGYKPSIQIITGVDRTGAYTETVVFQGTLVEEAENVNA